MELLESTTLSSFELNHLQIVDHSIDPPEHYTLTVAPFESILSIKQRITLHYKDPYPYLPDRLFLAVQHKDGYKPLEFQYANQTNVLPDPSTRPPPDRRFVDETGIQILVDTHYFTGYTDMLEDNTVHIWNLKKIASFITVRDLLQFHGVLQVYFPKIQSPEQVEQHLSTNLSRETKETFSYLQSHQTKVQDTLQRIETFVSMPHIFDPIESLRISYLTTFHASLPALPSLQKEGIDVFFYKLKASRHIPYIRYFPYGRAPIVKLATGPGGVPFITNIQILRSFSTDLPIMEEGSVIMTKTPIESQDVRVVQKGFAWTILFFENGRIEARLNAYRINDPITNPLIVRAFELLPQILSSLGWTGDAVSAMKLVKFAGLYEMQLAVGEQAGPTNQELQARIQAYSPFLFQEKTPLGIRWRGKNVEHPFEQALLLYSANNITKAKEQGFMLIQEFGIAPVEVRNAIERLGIKHKDEIEMYGAILPVEEDTLGPSVVIENNHPTLLFSFNHVLSSIDLQRFFTILQILVLTSNKVFLKKIQTIVAKEEEEEEEEEEDENNAFDILLNPTDAAPAEPIEAIKYNYLTFLEKADYNLFKFTSKKIKAYTTSCQKAQHRQPYVLSPNKFKDVKEKYKDRVHIVEFPLSEYNTEVATFIKKTPDERRKYNKKTVKEREMMEIHGLRLGLPLGGNVSFLGEKALPITKTLIEEQQSKELWVVARAGSSSPNYYICSKLWCAVDQIPILAEEYEGEYMRNGAKKTLVPCCPFCGQQNVVERKDDNIYVGYLKGKTHPKNMVLPCCYKSPDKATIPDGSAPIPPSPAGLETELLEMVGEEPKKSEAVLKDLGASFKRIQGSAIYILRSTSFPLDAGTYGVPTPHVDSILGQVLDVYSTTSKGQLKVVEDPHAFLRFGISADKQKSGQNFIQFISYLLFVCARIGNGAPGISSINMMCPTDTLEWMLDINQVSMARAFEAANYGMLIHEFHDASEPDPGTLGSSTTLTEFQTWMGLMKLEKADRAYVIRFYKAWNRFVEYVSDPNEPKEFRLWDGLFSTPGLFSKDGIVVARITANNLECPALGVSHYTRERNPVFVPVYYSQFLHIIEPLVYIETKKEYMGGIHPTAISKLSSGSRQKLTKLYAQYMQPIIGCGRPVPPLNVWIPLKHLPLPYTSTFLEYLRSHKDYTLHSILRERSNRAVGVLFTEKGVLFFIPLDDDGMIDTRVSSSYDIESLPLPTPESLYKLLINLSKTFPVLEPVEIRYKLMANVKQCVGFQLHVGTFVPFQMYEEGTKTFPITRLDILGEFPWDEDSILLKHEDAESMRLMREIEINPIELFEEAYQHLRLSLSNWLFRTEEGRATAIQIERLRSARNRLPLYELRKRGDLLLESLVRSWVTTEGVHTAPVLLRQDCLLLKEGECKGSCAMADGSCKIHTPTYGAMKDPAKVLSARLVDELLRSSGPAYEILQKHHSRVQILRPPTDLVREGESSLLSFEGRGDDSVYKRLGLKDRLFTDYTKGYIYPEEVSAEDLGREIATESGLPAGWEETGWSRAAELSDILLNLEKVRNAVLLNLLMEIEMTYSAFETALHELRAESSSSPIDWKSMKDLEYLSQILKANFILTRKKIRTGILEFTDLIKAPSSEFYILFDSDMIPMLYHPSDSLPVHSVGMEELPDDVRIAVEIRS